MILHLQILSFAAHQKHIHMKSLFYFCLALFFFWVFLKTKDKKYTVPQPKTGNKDFDEATEKINVGNYISGHPEIDRQFSGAILIKSPYNQLQIFERFKIGQYALASIPIKDIKNISVEDQTTVERRVSIARLLLVNVFALAWRKKQVNESAYLVIEWNDGKFDHETIFQVEGKGALQAMNTARNAIIRLSHSQS